MQMDLVDNGYFHEFKVYGDPMEFNGHAFAEYLLEKLKESPLLEYIDIIHDIYDTKDVFWIDLKYKGSWLSIEIRLKEIPKVGWRNITIRGWCRKREDVENMDEVLHWVAEQLENWIKKPIAKSVEA